MVVYGASTTMSLSAESIIYNLFVVLLIGVSAMLISKRVNVSFVPLLIVLGLVLGSLVRVLNTYVVRRLFDYVRVLGLVIILFSEGHNLHWPVLKKHITTIGTLDTVSLVITAIIAGLVFSYVFHLPFLAGFLFGAIISATDPATLIPLFRQHKVREDLKTILITESIFNDPLGIVLTTLAVALILPKAPSARFLASMARYVPIYVASVIYFLYEVAVSILIGVALGVLAYYTIKYLGFERSDEIFLFSLAIAFLGFFVGEKLGASGYLVATVIGIVLGNHHTFFKEKASEALRMQTLIDSEVHFNEILATFATVFIFVLLGASVRIDVLMEAAIPSIITALAVILIARPIAALPIIPVGKWSWKEYLFMSLEGPRGVVPSALATLPLFLGITYHVPKLVYWGEYILTATFMTVLISIIVETSWLPYIKKWLLGIEAE